MLVNLPSMATISVTWIKIGDNVILMEVTVNVMALVTIGVNLNLTMINVIGMEGIAVDHTHITSMVISVV
jgi:hypothetical protein